MNDCWVLLLNKVGSRWIRHRKMTWGTKKCTLQEKMYKNSIRSSIKKVYRVQIKISVQKFIKSMST